MVQPTGNNTNTAEKINWKGNRSVSTLGDRQHLCYSTAADPSIPGEGAELPIPGMGRRARLVLFLSKRLDICWGQKVCEGQRKPRSRERPRDWVALDHKQPPWWSVWSILGIFLCAIGSIGPGRKTWSGWTFGRSILIEKLARFTLLVRLNISFQFKQVESSYSMDRSSAPSLRGSIISGA
jgi:hypothetical protein